VIRVCIRVGVRLYTCVRGCKIWQVAGRDKASVEAQNPYPLKSITGGERTTDKSITYIPDTCQPHFLSSNRRHPSPRTSRNPRHRLQRSLLRLVHRRYLPENRPLQLPRRHFQPRRLVNLQNCRGVSSFQHIFRRRQFRYWSVC
jgi:hypothetical protein